MLHQKYEEELKKYEALINKKNEVDPDFYNGSSIDSMFATFDFCMGLDLAFESDLSSVSIFHTKAHPLLAVLQKLFGVGRMERRGVGASIELCR